MAGRSHVKRLGRRGGLLLLLAALWAGVAAQVAATRAPYDVADAVLYERIPTGWRIGLWLASALTADNPQVGYTLLPHSLWPVPA